MSTGRANRLASSMSPYLLQHAGNPVEWFPWGDEAFEQARKQDKPIFLSIGYSACHWCHVMARECFEDEEVAALMNETFISVKVDREELPHIDHVYMRACQLMTGSGGWPLTIVMTPGKEPFFAATYLPKHARYGLRGMMELIPLIGHAWKTTRGELAGMARKVSREAAVDMHRQEGDALDPEIARGVFQALCRAYQADTGGFSPAPKFPTPHHLMFLLRYHHFTGDEQALAMAEQTLGAMRRGGIYDHVGHGFHRYATDSLWRVPHFEKMLYDQALLALVYTEAFLVTSKSIYRSTASGTLEYALREMREENGLFSSALDADTEGEEGGSYLWTISELQSLLGPDDYRLLPRVFAVEPGGNFPQPPGGSENILFMREDIPDAARGLGMPAEELEKAVERISRILLDARGGRVAPFKDDKALTDWNGMIIAALARAGAAFGEPRYLAAAEAAAGFILENLRDGRGRLLHAYRAGRADHPALLDDYAFLAWGLIELYQATLTKSWLDRALALVHESVELFEDRERGGFFLTPADLEVVIARPRELMDNAVPSGNSVAFSNLLRLSRLTGDPLLEEKALGIARGASGMLRAFPAGSSFLAAGLLVAAHPSREVVIAGDAKEEDAASLLGAFGKRFLPEAVVAHATKGDDMSAPVIARGKEPVSGKAAAYVCQGHTCLPPVTGPAELLEVLSSPA